MFRWSLLPLGLVALAGAAAACEGLSPGDELNVGGFICTLGFIVADPDGLYFTTAGHCIDVDERASSPDVGEWGTGVFHFLEPETGGQSDGSPGFDFALVRIDPEVYPMLNPKMCGWDGPTGIYNETPGSGGVKQYGHGTLIGGIAPRREGYALTNDGDAFYWIGAGVPGDSGSAVLADDGRALGVLTHLTVGLAGDNGGTHLERGFRLAADAGFTDLRLVLMGEDPVQVLASMKAPAPVGAQPPAQTTPPPASPSDPSPSSPPPSSSPPPASTPPPEGVVPAGTSDELAPESPRNDTPAAPLALVVALGAALALTRRRR